MKNLTLFELLINLNFVKTEYNDKYHFKNGKLLIILPKENIEEYHYYSTKTQLVMYDFITEEEFDKLFSHIYIL